MGTKQRLAHIDALRGLAVLLMVMVHAAATWSPTSPDATSLLVYVVSGLGGLAAPLFVVLLGWGLHQRRFTMKQRIIRGAFLFGCQGLVNLFAPHLFDPLTPGILSLMGLLILTEPIWSLRWLETTYSHPQKARTFVGLFMISTPFLLGEAQSVSSWESRIHVSSWPELLQHTVLTGLYPVIPWVCFALFGTIIASSEQPKQFLQRVFLAGMVVSTAFLGISIHQDLPWAAPTGEAMLTFFPANTAFLVAAMTGVALCWLLVEAQRAMHALSDLGRASLTVYVAHFIPFALYHTVDEQGSWSLTQSMGATLGYTVLWAWLGTIWYRHARGATLESIMRRMERDPSIIEIPSK